MLGPLCMAIDAIMGITMDMYHLVMTNIAMENHHSYAFFIGKPSINGPFSMAMLNNQRVNHY